MNKLLTNEQAAAMLNISPGTLRVWRSTGRYLIPYIKVGANVRYDIDSILKFIEENTHLSKNELKHLESRVDNSVQSIRDL